MRAAARWRLAATNFAAWACRAASEACSKRAQTLACQRPLYPSMAAWKPLSRGGRRPALRSIRPIRPRDLVQGPIARALDPPLHRQQADPEPPGHRPQRRPGPHRCHHLPSTLLAPPLDRPLFAMAAPSQRVVVAAY